MLTILMVLMTLSTVGVSQEEEPMPYSVPQGRVIVNDGIEYKAFTLEEYKLLAHVIVEYRTYWSLRVSYKLEIKSLKDELDLKDRRIENCKDGVEIQKNRADMLSSMYDSQITQQIKQNKFQRFTQAFSWSLVVVESLALGVLGISYALKK